jgi:hypothetical protein
VAEQLYLGDLRQKSRPDIYVILKKLGEGLRPGRGRPLLHPEARYEDGDKFVRMGGALMDATTAGRAS